MSHLPDAVEQQRRRAYRDLWDSQRDLQPLPEKRMIEVYPEGDERQEWMRRQLRRWREQR